jgi:hypothetical protein
MSVKPERVATLNAAMIASGQRKKRTYQTVAGRASQPG